MLNIIYFVSTFFPIVSGGLTGLALALKWNLQSFRTSLKEKIGGENLSNKEDKKYHRPCQRVHGAEHKNGTCANSKFHKRPGKDPSPPRCKC